MKKIIFLFLVSFVMAFGLGAQSVTLSQIVGKVEVKQPNASNWSKATEGMIIPIKSTLSTGFNSTVTAKVAGSILKIKPLTRMSVAEYAMKDGKETAVVNLGAGKVQANVKSLDGKKMDFKVTSPVATASVRGTEFDFNGYRLNVSEGNVFYQNFFHEGTSVGHGQNSSIRDNNTPEDPEASFEDQAFIDPTTEVDLESDDDNFDFEDFSDNGQGEINGLGTLQLYIN